MRGSSLNASAEKRTATRFASFLAMSIATMLALGCAQKVVDSNDQPVVDHQEAAVPSINYHVVVISGFESDPTDLQIAGQSMRGVGNSGMFQLKGDLESEGIDCSFFNWNGTDAGDIHNEDAGGAVRIASSMIEIQEKNNHTEFIFVGHSWGAHTFLDVATELVSNSDIKINSSFVIDASSFMRGKRKEKLPENIPSLTSYHTANSFCWGPWKNEPRITNVDLADPENGYTVNGHPNYASSFDTAAHTHAEWDQKIHGDIRKQILAILEK